MPTQRKIIVSVATSTVGYIARGDGSVDWLDRPRPKGNYGIGEFFRSIDTVLCGRQTLEPVLADVVFTSEPPGNVARRLRSEPGKHISAWAEPV